MQKELHITRAVTLSDMLNDIVISKNDHLFKPLPPIDCQTLNNECQTTGSELNNLAEDASRKMKDLQKLINDNIKWKYCEQNQGK